MACSCLRSSSHPLKGFAVALLMIFSFKSLPTVAQQSSDGGSSIAPEKQGPDDGELPRKLLYTLFPGRRVVGSTRAECTSRLLVHLVSPASVYSPGPSRYLALLKGPTTRPRPAVVSFRTYLKEGSTYRVGPVLQQKQLDPAGPGVYLLRSPGLREPMVWESSFNCQEDADSEIGLLGFVQAAAPPAMTLLLDASMPGDKIVAKNISWLTESCDANVVVQELSRRFQLADLITSDWPTELPVLCADAGSVTSRHSSKISIGS